MNKRIRRYGGKRLVVTATTGALLLALTAAGCDEPSEQDGKAAGAQQQRKSGERIVNQAATGGGGGGAGGGIGRGHTVKTWKKVSVRTHPDQGTKRLRSIGKGKKVSAECWTIGRMVRAEGTANEIWVHVKNGWSSAIYFKGDKFAGLPKDARC
ncbi:hypothetical protein DSC45_17810 [Streptomyces sp. YIM 130001]|uniref:hypothetical protein n=1 Tax=Streptomyces sp. YIM 130001 TaxID=2259644 RepID=UPI000E65A478|nr:hypothetical protein [Streptomyces sp. YIM 130001]RII15689.1 hypothetical protein DSC45_17810 [Streptomyces sp. YIM 130001]